VLKELKQQLVKDAIIAETKKQFLIKGIQKTTLRQIAKKLGIAFGNIYYYYKSKTDICGVIWQGYSSVFLDGFQNRLKSTEFQSKNGLEKLQSYYVLLFEYYQQNPLYIELISFSMNERQVNFTTSLAEENESRRIVKRIKRTLIELYREGISDGSIRSEITDIQNEAWSFNIAYTAIVINIIRYQDIGEEVYNYFVNTYFRRLALCPTD